MGSSVLHSHLHQNTCDSHISFIHIVSLPLLLSIEYLNVDCSYIAALKCKYATAFGV